MPSRCKKSKLKPGPQKRLLSFVRRPRPLHPQVISKFGRQIQTVHIHPIISKYG